MGIPDYKKRDRKVVTHLANVIRKHKIQVEIMSSELACPTFNFLHSEGRFVAAGIIPPIDVDGEDATGMASPMAFGYVKDT